MTAQKSGYFTLQEANRLKIIQDVIDGRNTLKPAQLKVALNVRIWLFRIEWSKS